MANTTKYLLFATNFLVFILGLVCLGIGIYALVDGAGLADLVSKGSEQVGESITISIFTTAAIVIIVISVLVVVVTFFGCCGAWKENRCMLGIYFTIILTFFIVFVVGAVIGNTQSTDELETYLEGSIKLYGTTEDTDEVMKKTWDQIQSDYTCCGAGNFSDWPRFNKNFPVSGQERVPKSCCPDNDDECLKCGGNFNGCVGEKPGDHEHTCWWDITSVKDCIDNHASLKGCLTKFEDTIEKNKSTILGVVIGTLVIMFINMLLAFALCTMAK